MRGVQCVACNAWRAMRDTHLVMAHVQLTSRMVEVSSLSYRLAALALPSGMIAIASCTELSTLGVLAEGTLSASKT